MRMCVCVRVFFKSNTFYKFCRLLTDSNEHYRTLYNSNEFLNDFSSFDKNVMITGFWNLVSFLSLCIVSLEEGQRLSAMWEYTARWCYRDICEYSRVQKERVLSPKPLGWLSHDHLETLRKQDHHYWVPKRVM